MATKKDKRGIYFGLKKEHAKLVYQPRWVDLDYLDKLNDKEKEWLSRFNEGYVHGHFFKDKKGPKFSKDTKRALWRDQNSCEWDLLTRTSRTLQVEFVDGILSRGGVEDQDEKVKAECPKCAGFILIYESTKVPGVYMGLCKNCYEPRKRRALNVEDEE